MKKLFEPVLRLFSNNATPPRESAQLVDIEVEANEAIYAIGDIHGEIRLLDALLDIIEVQHPPSTGQKALIFLGDYIDRGPRSAQVIDRLIALRSKGAWVHCLMGNHEQMFLDFIGAPSAAHEWLRHGGLDTLASYGIAADLRRAGRSELSRLIAAHIPREHIEFLKSLQHILRAGRLVFVHAGIRPGTALERQTLEDVLWIRDGFLDQPLDTGLTVVHGHTPGQHPVSEGGRICVDTGAYASGILTAVRLSGDEEPSFVSTLAQ